MHGPQPRPPSYASVSAELKDVPTRLDNAEADPNNSEKIGNAMVDWMIKARSEANTLSSDNLEF